MKVKVYRFDQSINKEGYLDEFNVPIPINIKWTIMEVLDYIALNLDSSLSYYKHSVCNHGICGRCILRVNGKIKLACTCIANDYNELVLEPKTFSNMVKDLVVK